MPFPRPKYLLEWRALTVGRSMPQRLASFDRAVQRIQVERVMREERRTGKLAPKPSPLPNCMQDVGAISDAGSYS